MQGNGIVLFIVGATVLWIAGHNWGSNVGPAWNVLTGVWKASGATTSTTPPASSSNTWQPNLSQGVSYAPPAIPYQSVGYA